MLTNSPPRFTFFFGCESPLSQWHYAPFMILEPWKSGARREIVFANAEQFMMAAKAAHFGDRRTYDRILATCDPRRVKQLGRSVAPFDAAEWRRVARPYVREGNLAKFSQNAGPRAALLTTGDTLLVEASPFDRTWGIGLAADHPDASNPARWRGTNWLGEVLTDVREVLRSA